MNLIIVLVNVFIYIINVFEVETKNYDYNNFINKLVFKCIRFDFRLGLF